MGVVCFKFTSNRSIPNFDVFKLVAKLDDTEYHQSVQLWLCLAKRNSLPK